MGFLKILTGKQRRVSAAAATKSAALDVAFSADITETVNPRRRSFLGISRRSSSGTKTPSSPSAPVPAVPPCDLVYFTFRCSACKDRRYHCGANNEFKSGCHRAYARNSSSPATTLSPRQADKFTWPVEVKIYTIWVDFCGIGQWHNISETIKTHVGLWGDYDMDECCGRAERLPTDLDRFLGVLEGKKVLAGVSMS